MQENPLNEKVALITGAARRIGAEIARTLHEAGLKIIVHYDASEKEAIDLCEQLNQKRPQSAVIIHTHLEEQGSEEELIAKAYQAWQRLDVLVNNAAKFYRTPFLKVTEYEWGDLLTSNLKVPFFLARAAAPLLVKQQGVIVNITDIHAKRPLRDYAVYCLTKSGLEMMTKVLAKELAPHVRVNAVAPGAVLWPEGENTLSMADKQKIIDRTFLKRGGTALDIAKAVLYFVRDADYVTGQILRVEGGRILA